MRSRGWSVKQRDSFHHLEEKVTNASAGFWAIGGIWSRLVGLLWIEVRVPAERVDLCILKLIDVYDEA
ncbi:unnamed protein product [Calypogeia fissa]